MSAKSKNNKWKDALLKTSLPLEHIIAERLGKKRFNIWGEFSFIRENEHGLETEFSIDLRAVHFFRKGSGFWSYLNLLVECKYNYPGVKWVFAPHPQRSIVVTGVVSKFQLLCTRRVLDTTGLYSLDNKLEFCVKGIELHENDSNPQSIERGLHQLRWGVPQLAAQIVNDQATTLHDVDLLIGFVCPILVCTAPLYVLRPGLKLNRFLKASALSDVADKVDAVIVYKERGPQLNAYIRGIRENIYKQTEGLKDRVDSFWTIDRTNAEKEYLSSTWDFNTSFDSIAERVLIVNIDAFDEIVSSIRDSVKEAGKTLKRIAKMNTNVQNRTVKIVGNKHKSPAI